MKVLVLDNNIDPESHGAKELVRFAGLVPHATFVVRRPPDEDLPRELQVFDKLIISGSKTSAVDEAPWIDRYLDHVRRWVESGKPVLGVCYGHQSIARAMGGLSHVGKAKTPEFGWTEITRVANSPIFEGLPDRFVSFSSHYDEVTRLPPGTEKLAHSEDCGIQGYHFTDRPVFAIQFHPEKNLDEGTRIFDYLKRTGEQKLFRNLKEGKKLFNAAVGKTIFGNFLKL